MKNLIVIILALMCFAKTAYAEYQLNEMPMYDGKHNPKVYENKEASKGAAELGWKYFYNGDHDTAIKRFNQAWMFNRRNPQAFWGFGLIMGERATKEDTEKNLKESIKFLQQALALLPDNSRLMVDIAYSETLLGAYLKSNGSSKFKNHFDNARLYYTKSEKIDTEYPLLYFNWSILEFYKEKYKEAENKLNKAKKLGFEPNPKYEKDLSEKLRNR